MKPVTVHPILGHSVLFPPGHVRITLSPEYRRAYLLLYGQSFPLADIPALKDSDFDGRSIKMSRPQLAALNRRFQDLEDGADPRPRGVFREQERTLADHSKKTQFLS